MSTRLLRDTPYTFLRPPTESLSPSGRPIDHTILDCTEIETKGSLQPYRRGATTIVEPEGIKTRSILIYYTASKLNTVEEGLDIEADFLLLNGRKYKVFDVADNSLTSTLISMAHYEYLLVMEEGYVEP